MRMLFAACALLLLGSASASAQFIQCKYRHIEGTSTRWQYCPGGHTFEQRRLYVGVWGAWEKTHPNVRPPCTWDGKAATWTCEDTVYRCTHTQCN